MDTDPCSGRKRFAQIPGEREDRSAVFTYRLDAFQIEIGQISGVLPGIECGVIAFPGTDFVFQNQFFRVFLCRLIQNGECS